MELAVSILVILLAFWLFHKLGGLERKSTAQKLSGKGEGPNDKAGLSPAIALVLRKSPDDANAESGETITVIVTEGDPFHEEWEVIPDSDQDEDPHDSDTFPSPKEQ